MLFSMGARGCCGLGSTFPAWETAEGIECCKVVAMLLFDEEAEAIVDKASVDE